MKEQMNRDKAKDANNEEVSWPAGAIEENNDYNQETREQVEAAQEEMETNMMETMDDKAKNVVSTSKMFSKIRNRIKTKPLKIQLKTNKLSTEEDEGIGLQPQADNGDMTPLEPLSGEDEQNFGGYYEVGDEYDVKDDGNFNDDEEERRVARYRERNKKRRERALEAGELEDGEHSPSPEPERPHHRRRRKRRHERREEDMEEGEIGEEKRESRRSRGHREDRDMSGPPGSGPLMLGVPPPRLPFIDTTRPPPMPVAHPPLVHHQPPPLQAQFYPPASVGPPVASVYPGPAYNAGPGNEMYNAYSSPTKGYHGLGQVKSERPNYYDSLPAQPRPSDQMEAVDSEDDDDAG